MLARGANSFWLKAVTFIVITVLVCQNIVWVRGDVLAPWRGAGDMEELAGETGVGDTTGQSDDLPEENAGIKSALVGLYKRGFATLPAGDNQPEMADLRRVLREQELGKRMDVDRMFSLQTRDRRQKYTFVIAPRGVAEDRNKIMRAVLIWREFLDSPAGQELLALRQDMPKGMEKLLLTYWAGRFPEDIEKIKPLFKQEALAGIIKGLPLALLESYDIVKKIYPGLNIVPDNVLGLLAAIEVTGYAKGFISDDIADITRKLREKGIAVEIVQLVSRKFKWPRDLIAWIDDERYISSELSQPGHAITNGGMIVPGAGKQGCFLLVSTETPPEQVAWLRRQCPEVTILPIHPGFITVRHQGELFHVPTPHIDSVVAFIPGELTRDGHNKLLIDPQYMRFEQERLIELVAEEDLDIVTVAEDELHLQMANCVVVKGQLIINNGEETIKKLNLKEGVVICPDIPNTEGVWGFGLYRCQSNILPESILSGLVPLELDMRLDPEELVRSLHLQAFCGQEPGRDVTEDLARVVAEQGYDQKTIFRALVKFANDTDGEPPTWWGINALVEMLAEEARIFAEAV